MQIIELKYYIDLLPCCNIFSENGMIQLFFHSMETKSYYIAQEFAKSADERYIIENAFEDDNTINHVVKFKKNRLEDIAFMQYILTKSNNQLSGYAIKGIGLLDFYLGIEIDPPNRCYGEPKNSVILNTSKKPLFGLNKYIKSEEKEYYRFLLCQLYRWFNENINYYKLPENTPYKTRISLMQAKAIQDFLNKNYTPYKLRNEKPEYNKIKIRNYELIKTAKDKDNAQFNKMLSVFKNRYNEIYHNLVEKGFVSPMWKSEYKMYKLVKSFFNDAIYQYSAEWLKPQTLDVYIPSKMIGIEYQGEQHYKAIDHFGGQESFTQTKERDAKKKLLCKINNIILIEWKYDEPINEVILKRKLNIT